MPTPVENLLTVIQADQAHYLGTLHDDFVRLTEAVKSLKTAKSSGSGGKGASAVEGAEGAEAAASLGEVAAVAGGVAAALAAIPAAVAAITYAAMPFVQALSPSSVEAFNVALDGLKATIGEALLPIISYAASSLREWAGILLPTIRELKPMVDQLASAVSGFMAGFVRVAVAAFSLLLKVVAPLVTSLSGWLDLMGQVLEVVAVVITVLSTFTDVINVLRGILEGPVFGLWDALGLKMKDFQDIIGKAVVGLAALAAMVLKLAGANDTLNKFREGLAKTIAARKAPEAGLTAAPKDAAVTGIDSIVSKMNERAFVATSGAPTARGTDDLLEEMLKAVNMIADDNDLKNTIKEAISESLPGGKTVSSIATVVGTVTDSSATSRQRFNTAREEGGGIIGGTFAVGGGLLSDGLQAINPF
jgi:hypothetical protein